MTVPSGVLALTWTTMVKPAIAPLGRDAVVQLTVPVDPTGGFVQDQPAGGVTDWKVVNAGRTSSIFTVATAIAHALTPVMVESRMPPSVFGSSKQVLAIARLASARTVVVAVAALLARSGPKVTELTL